MKNIIYIIVLGSIITACKKFDHEVTKKVPDCTYCHLADSIEGSYTGRLVKRNYSPTPISTEYGATNYDTILDTIITVYVDRTYEGLNYYEDSTIFKFNSSHFYDEILLTETSIQSGEYLPSDHRKTQQFTEDNEMIYKRESVFNAGPYGLYYYIDYEFIGQKDE